MKLNLTKMLITIDPKLKKLIEKEAKKRKIPATAMIRDILDAWEWKYYLEKHDK